MSAAKTELLKAVDLALAGEWEAAHSIVQQYEDTDTGAWIHAVLHKIEGDLGEQPLLVSHRRKDGAGGG